MPDPADSPEPSGRTSKGIAQAALWLAGSAVFGSMALVLWNRRALQNMRQAADAPPAPSRPRDEDGIY